MPILCKRETVNKDHPRACGANVRGARYAVLRDGSSPRVRGKPGGDPPVGHQLRIIPARAGQTPACSHCRRTFPDHPRACGANQQSAYLRRGQYGSSPRVRGKLKQRFRIWKRGRIIPARAGQTLRPDDVAGPDADHPRACGANRSKGSQITGHSGSSPRVRGKLPGIPGIALVARIIPARAGQTSCSSVFRCRRTDHPRACGANRS